MADKKLSDVTSVEDFDYFLGVKSNGDVQKMSKDSMKKVISELTSSFLQIKSPKNFIVSNPSNMETGIISIGDASREISKSEKLNEPSEDIPFIRGLDSKGNPIYIGTEQFSSVLAGLTVRKMELGWLAGYTKLTDYADFGTMLIYITGDNRQSLIMLCDIQRVIMLHDEHRDDELAVYRKEDGGYYLYTASYNLYAYIISSSFTLSIVKGQDGNGLIKINRA